MKFIFFWLVVFLDSSKIKGNILKGTLKGNLSFFKGYYLDVFLGTPFQEQSLLIDTGSSIMALSCADCYPLDCGSHLNPYFSPNISQTSTKLKCGNDSDPKCPCLEGATGDCLFVDVPCLTLALKMFQFL